ncbi:MAG: DUF86 domain-containing protein [Anaerolineales bacterium]|nr:MAG: DUF86 domain-containing protein [Anaerolineales bacterium]
MDERQARLIQQKLMNMDSYIGELGPYLESSLEEHLKKPGQRRIVERLAQVIIESAIDTNNLLIVASGGAPASTARQSFAAVHTMGVIDDHLLTCFRQTYLGLRNRIVRDYDVLDNKVVYLTARRLMEDARKYLGSVYRYLSEVKNQKR